jgi:hypothetical protein
MIMMVRRTHFGRVVVLCPGFPAGRRIAPLTVTGS